VCEEGPGHAVVCPPPPSRPACARAVAPLWPRRPAQCGGVHRCLAKNNHKEKWCKAVIDLWRECERSVKAAEAAEAAAKAAASGAGS